MGAGWTGTMTASAASIADRVMSSARYFTSDFRAPRVDNRSEPPRRYSVRVIWATLDAGWDSAEKSLRRETAKPQSRHDTHLLRSGPTEHSATPSRSPEDRHRQAVWHTQR